MSEIVTIRNACWLAAAISIVGGVVPPSIACGQGGGGFASPDGRRESVWQLPGSPPVMTDKEQARAQPLPASDGARWTINTERLFLRGDRLGNRRTYLLTNHHIFTPFENYLLKRNLSDGHFGHLPLVFEEPIDQLAYSDNRRSWAFTLGRPDQPVRTRDILFQFAEKRNVMQRLVGHEAKPWRIVISPGGTRLVSCANDGTIRLWNLESAELIKQMPAFTTTGLNPPRGEFVAFSPDGKWLATVQPGKIAMHHAADGVERFNLPLLPNSRPDTICFSPDSQSLFAFGGLLDSAHPNAKFVQIEVDTRKRQYFDGTARVTHGVVTPDNKYVITWASHTPEVSIWAIESRKEFAKLKAAPQVVSDIALAPNGKVIATIGDDQIVKFWDIPSGKQRTTKLVYKHDDGSLLRFSPNGKALTTHGDTGVLKVWDAPEFAWVHGW